MRSHPLRRKLWTTETGRINSRLNGRHFDELPPSLIDSKMTKSQFVARRAHELVPANRGQPPQCASEHGSRDGRRQEKVAAECTSSWPDGRNRDRRAGRCRGLWAFEMAATADYDA
jgi:hypothetical protein